MGTLKHPLSKHSGQVGKAVAWRPSGWQQTFSQNVIFHKLKYQQLYSICKVRCSFDGGRWIIILNDQLLCGAVYGQHITSQCSIVLLNVKTFMYVRPICK